MTGTERNRSLGNSETKNESVITGGQMNRRTVLHGAAWSLPVIAVAVATPLAAASEVFVCPVLAPAGTWTWQVPVSGTLRTGNNGQAAVRNGAHGQEFYVSHEAAASTGSVVIRVSTVLEVVAGHTYDFSFFFGANYGNLVESTSVRSAVRLDVGTTTLFNGSTRPLAGNTLIPNNTTASGYQNYGSTTRAFTATTSEMITVAYVFVMTATTAAVPAGDDIAITLPVITCR